jgi:hypothetical protein
LSLPLVFINKSYFINEYILELFQKIDLDDIFGDSDRTPKNVMPLVMNMKSLRKMIQHDEDNTKLTNVALKDEHHQKKY